MPDTDLTQLIDGEGNFTDAGRTALSSEFGEDHADFKGFDGVNKLGTLGKMYADTKAMVGKKLDNVIQKPGENATDEEKATYQTAINEARGVPAEAATYEFDKEGMHESITITEQEETFWKNAFHEANVDPAGSKVLFDAYKAARNQEVAEMNAASEAFFQAESAKLKEIWKGDAMIENPRIAINAIKAFGGDEIVKSLTDQGVFQDPANMDKWMKVGVLPNQLLMWGNIGKAMKTGTVLKNSGTPEAGDESPRAQAMRQYPNSPELWPKE